MSRLPTADEIREWLGDGWQFTDRQGTPVPDDYLGASPWWRLGGPLTVYLLGPDGQRVTVRAPDTMSKFQWGIWLSWIRDGERNPRSVHGYCKHVTFHDASINALSRKIRSRRVAPPKYLAGGSGDAAARKDAGSAPSGDEISSSPQPPAANLWPEEAQPYRRRLDRMLAEQIQSGGQDSPHARERCWARLKGEMQLREEMDLDRYEYRPSDDGQADE